MAQLKKRKVSFRTVLVLLIFLLGSLWLLHAFLYPKWVGASPNGKWKVIYERPLGSGNYEGKVYWQGDNRSVTHTYLTLTQLRVNGEYYAGGSEALYNKNEAVIANPNTSNLPGFIHKWDLKHKDTVQYLRWRQGQQPEQQEKIHLKKEWAFGF